MAPDEEKPKEKAKEKKEDKPFNWAQILSMWGAIAFFLLFAGGLAIQALKILQGGPAEHKFDLWTFWAPLFLFSLGGGLAIGLLILTWWLVVKRGFSWTVGFAVLAVVLFALFVWPSPYRYDKDHRKETTCRVLQVHRWTGEWNCIVPGPKAAPLS